MIYTHTKTQTSHKLGFNNNSHSSELSNTPHKPKLTNHLAWLNLNFKQKLLLATKLIRCHKYHTEPQLMNKKKFVSLSYKK